MACGLLNRQTMSTTSNTVFSPGELLGSYRILRELDRGGMSIIYEALNEAICKHVAIKVLLPELASQEAMVQRFLNEARVVNQIAHSGLVTIFELGKTSSGHQYIVMELLEGVTLGKLLLHVPKLGLPTVLCILQQVASALSATHAQQIIHRDLKPANIFLSRDRAVHGDLRAKVLDFGVAKVAPRTESVESDGMLTRTGTFLGTPFFVAPEQIHDASQVTDRADVYSMGVILFQCLTGRLPFSGTSSSVLVGHLKETPSRLRAIDSSIPAVVDDLCAAMLSKEAHCRPSMTEVDRCFGLLLSDLATTTVRRSAEALFSSSLWSIENAPLLAGSYHRLAGTSNRRKLTGLIAGVLAISSAAIGGVWLSQARRSADTVQKHTGGQAADRPAANSNAVMVSPAEQDSTPNQDTTTPPIATADAAQGVAVVAANAAAGSKSDGSEESVPKERASVASSLSSGRAASTSVSSSTAIVKGRNRNREEPRRPPQLPVPADSPTAHRQSADFTDDDVRVHN